MLCSIGLFFWVILLWVVASFCAAALWAWYKYPDTTPEEGVGADELVTLLDDEPVLGTCTGCGAKILEEWAFPGFCSYSCYRKNVKEDV
jgi:hypothetical protein